VPAYLWSYVTYLCCSPTELRAVFSVFDMDRDGFITVDEVLQVLESMGFLPSPASIDDIFRQVDLDGRLAVRCQRRRPFSVALQSVYSSGASARGHRPPKSWLGPLHPPKLCRTLDTLWSIDSRKN